MKNLEIQATYKREGWIDEYKILRFERESIHRVPSIVTQVGYVSVKSLEKEYKNIESKLAYAIDKAYEATKLIELFPGDEVYVCRQKRYQKDITKIEKALELIEKALKLAERNNIDKVNVFTTESSLSCLSLDILPMLSKSVVLKDGFRRIKTFISQDSSPFLLGVIPLISYSDINPFIDFMLKDGTKGISKNPLNWYKNLKKYIEGDDYKIFTNAFDQDVALKYITKLRGVVPRFISPINGNAKDLVEFTDNERLAADNLNMLAYLFATELSLTDTLFRQICIKHFGVEYISDIYGGTYIIKDESEPRFDLSEISFKLVQNSVLDEKNNFEAKFTIH